MKYLGDNRLKKNSNEFDTVMKLSKGQITLRYYNGHKGYLSTTYFSSTSQRVSEGTGQWFTISRKYITISFGDPRVEVIK